MRRSGPGPGFVFRKRSRGDGSYPAVSRCTRSPNTSRSGQGVRESPRDGAGISDHHRAELERPPQLLAHGARRSSDRPRGALPRARPDGPGCGSSARSTRTRETAPRARSPPAPGRRADHPAPALRRRGRRPSAIGTPPPRTVQGSTKSGQLHFRHFATISPVEDFSGDTAMSRQRCRPERTPLHALVETLRRGSPERLEARGSGVPGSNGGGVVAGLKCASRRNAAAGTAQ